MLYGPSVVAELLVIIGGLWLKKMSPFWGENLTIRVNFCFDSFRCISAICPEDPPWTDSHQIWHGYSGCRRNHLRQIFWRSVEGC